LSNPRVFAIGYEPEMIESANDAFTNAMEVSIGSVINGRTDPNAADYFKFALKTGQRIFISCAASALDSRCLPVFTLYDDSGQELARNRTEALLDFAVPNDMTAIVKLHDIIFRGGSDFHYRLSIITGPHIDYLFPLAVLPNTTNACVIYGRNLPGGEPVSDIRVAGKPLEQLSVSVTPPPNPNPNLNLNPNLSCPGIVPSGGPPIDSVPIEGFNYRLTTSNGLSNPFFIGSATAPVVLETEPNDKPDTPQQISPPCEVNGQFYPANDRDCFRFDAKKGEVYWIEVFSERLGFHTDPFLVVQRLSTNGTASDVKELYDGETVNAGSDMKADSRDPAWRFEVNEDATYLIQVRDLFNRLESDSRLIYRLCVRRDVADFNLLVTTESPPLTKPDAKDVRVWPPFLRRGGTMPLRVTAVRRGYTDEIRLSLEGLPTGVSASESRIPAGKNSALLLVSAADDVSGWAGPIHLVGIGKAGGSEIRREARGAALIHPVEDKTKEPLCARLTDSFSFAVSSNELAPIIITAEAKAYEIGAAGKVSIPLKVRRNGDFTEAFKLKPTPLSALESLGEIDVPANGTNATIEIDLAKHKLPPGEHMLCLRGQAKGKYRRNPEAVTFAEQQLKASDKLVAELAGDIKKAETTLAASSVEAKAAAEQSLADFKAKLKEAEAQKAPADTALKQATERAKPQEVTFTVYSAPIYLRVSEEKKLASGAK
jgi:hypothetical protein